MRIFTSLLVATALSGAVSAQTTINDSIQTGGSYANDVYYSLESGKVKELGNNDWQLAFSIGNFNVAVRANTTTGSSGDGSVSIYEMAGKDTTKWASFDTLGYASWPKLENSDESWEEGAFNQSASGQTDYGWGAYNTATHVVTGHRLYLAVVKSGTSTLYKKVWILSKALGVWNIRFANIDGSDPKELTIASSAYNTKNFAYVSLVTGNIVDREPANDAWDFILTRYAAWQPAQSVYYPSIGILTNVGVTVSEVRGKDENNTTLSDTTTFSDNITTIGADWKQLNSQTFAFYAVDSLSYFIKDNYSDIWKVVFTNFTSGSSATGTGRAVFNKSKVYTAPVVGLNETSSISTFAVYPNPATDNVNVLFDVKEANSTVSVSDLSGRTLITENISGTGFQNTNLNLGSLSKGIYFISIANGSSRSVKKVVVQ